MQSIDVREKLKLKRYAEACDAQGWDYAPFVADAFGALSSQARRILGDLLDTKLEGQSPEGAAARAEVWGALTGAAFTRAARQRVRARASDKPAGLAVSLLDFTHTWKLTPNHWLPPPVVPPESQAVEIPHPQSSSSYPQLELSTGHFDKVKPSCAPTAEPQPAVPRGEDTTSTTRNSILRYVPACLAKLNIKS